jgi:hypothetical protein
MVLLVVLLEEGNKETAVEADAAKVLLIFRCEPPPSWPWTKKSGEEEAGTVKMTP